MNLPRKNELNASILRNRMVLLSMTALPLALCMGYAEARGVGITNQSYVQVARSAGRATNSQTESLIMPWQATDLIVAERTRVQVQASEASSLLNELRLQLAAQLAARLNIRWQLTRPAEMK